MDPSDTQLIENEITNIFKSNPATSMMEHSKLVQFLHDELNKLGFNNLEKVDILKYATIVRDPVTKESVIPFETRPTKSNEMKNLAWEKIHQEARGHFQGKDLANITYHVTKIILRLITMMHLQNYTTILKIKPHLPSANLTTDDMQ